MKMEDLDSRLSSIIERYRARTPASRARFENAVKVMPGGNTRSVLFYAPYPLCMTRGWGCRLSDVDGHEYVDFLGEFTAGIFGHSDPVIRAAIVEALDNGLNLAGHNPLEAELARIVQDRFASIESMRFTNSGTEANLMALAAAKAFTGRKRVMVFRGAYHGGVLTFVGCNAPVNVPHDFVLAPYNDTQGCLDLIDRHRDELAAILVEPMLGAGGCVPGDPAFLSALRQAATQAGALLIFDEVMTSRLSVGGRQALLGIKPDMTTLGKYIGGGASFGAFGGRRDVMTLFDPRNPQALSHAGTFNNNVLTMAAGIAGMSRILTPDAINNLNRRGDGLREGLNKRFHAAGAPLQVTGLGSIMNFHVTSKPINNLADAQGGDQRLRELLFFHLLERGIYVARRGLIALSLPLGSSEIDRMIAVIDEFLAENGETLRKATA